VNLTSEATWRAPLDELIPIGPLEVKVRLTGVRPAKARLLVAGVDGRPSVEGGHAVITVASLTDHEVIVFE
jgi:hypothetical protein